MSTPTLIAVMSFVAVQTLAFPVFVFWLLRRIGTRPRVAEGTNRLSWAVRPLVAFNMVGTALYAVAMVLAVCWLHHGADLPQELLPALTPVGALSAVAGALFLLVLVDALNWAFHRLCHENDWLYQRMHYVHHEYVVPDGLRAFFYVHPVEMLISSAIFITPIVLVPWSVYTIYLYGSASIVLGAIGHAGVRLPGRFGDLFSPDVHARHHSDYRCNYAEHFTWVDRLLGTYLPPLR